MENDDQRNQPVNFGDMATVPNEGNFNNFTDERDVNKTLWFVNVTLSVIGTIIPLYVALAFIVYQVWRRRKPQYCSKRNRGERNFGTIARILCLTLGLLITLRHSLKLLSAFVDLEAQKNNGQPFPYDCSILGKAKEVCLVLCLSTIYLFLWTRQRVFYIHKALRHLNSRTMRVASYLILLVWVVYVAVATCTLLATVQYIYSPGIGCVVSVGTAKILRNILISYVIASTLMQISLLYLFIYPIIRQSTIGIQNGTDGRSKNRLMLRVKKAIILSAICIFTDVISVIVSIVTFSREANTFSSTYIINLTISLFCLIFCFDDWKFILVPCTSKEDETGSPNVRSNQSVSQTSNKDGGLTKSSYL